MNNEGLLGRARGNRTFEGIRPHFANSIWSQAISDPRSARKFCWEMRALRVRAAWRFDLGALCDVKSAASVIN